MNVELSLLEAMCGFTLVICQLDKRKLIINHTGKTIQPNDMMKISGEGMHVSNSKNKGDIIIHFTVTLPKNLDNSRKDILKQVLPQNKRNNMVVDDNDIKEVKNLEDVKMSQEQHQHQHQFQHHENPLEDIGQGVQCAQQ
jgi:DnaJ-class molecular chaperone